MCFQVGKNMAYARSLFSAGDKFGPQVGYQREKLVTCLCPITSSPKEYMATPRRLISMSHPEYTWQSRILFSIF